MATFIEQLVEAIDTDDDKKIKDLLEPYKNDPLSMVLEQVKVGHLVEFFEAAMARRPKID